MALLCHLASAQHKLSGSVITGNSQPLPGVTIYIQEINKGTISDANGYYQLNNLPEGELKVQFSFIGFTFLILNNVFGSIIKLYVLI